LTVLIQETLQFAERYNAHSFNELGVFHNNVRKGIHMHKIDIAYIYQDDCIKNTAHPINTKLCTVIKDLPTCCLGLVGDVGSVPFFWQHPFNTTDELINLTNQPDFKENLRLLNKTLYIQLEFMSQFSIWDDFSDLLLDFLTRIDNFATANNGNIKYYTAPCMQTAYQARCEQDPANCIPQLWQILQSENIRCSHEFFYEVPDQFDTQLNLNYPVLIDSCRNNYFQEQFRHSKDPFTFWEIEDEKALRSFVDYLEDPKLCPVFPRDHDWSITSNIEPEKFMIFMMEEGVYNQDFGRGYVSLYDIQNPD
jgi:hypothetical protein